MKKSIVLLSLFAAAALVFAGCTQAGKENKQNEDSGIAKFVGDWDYQVMDQNDTENFTDNGHVVINEDGSYNYTSPDGNISTGSVRLEYEEYFDDTRLPMFNFYSDDDSFWIGSYYDENDPDTLWIGNGGEERLVKTGGH